MMAIDDLLATIPSLQRGDLERWIREELVVPQQDAGLSFSDRNSPGSVSSAP